MAKKEQAAKRRGRPKKSDRMEDQLNVRVGGGVKAAMEAYRERYDLGELSDAARHIINRVLRDERLL